MGRSDKDSVKPRKRIEITVTKELIGCVQHDCKHSKEQADALESLTRQLAERDAEVERLKDLLSIVDGSVLQAAQRCMDRVKKLCDERDALRAQLAAAQGQKPVAWIDAFDNISHADSETDESKIGRDPLYAAPIPQQPSVPEGWKPTEVAIAALRRFEETCADGEGYDVPKEDMRQLGLVGLVHHISAGRYVITDFGQHVLAAAPQPKEPK